MMFSQKATMPTAALFFSLARLVGATLPRELITTTISLLASAPSLAHPGALLLATAVPVDPATNVLAGLPALRKVHHSWPLSVNWTAPQMQRTLKDYARITHAVGLSMEDVPGPAQDAVTAAVRICSITGAIIEFTYSHWGVDASPSPRNAIPMYEGLEETAELALFLRQCTAAGDAIRPWYLSSAEGKARGKYFLIGFFNSLLKLGENSTCRLPGYFGPEGRLKISPFPHQMCQGTYPTKL